MTKTLFFLIFPAFVHQNNVVSLLKSRIEA